MKCITCGAIINDKQVKTLTVNVPVIGNVIIQGLVRDCPICKVTYTSEYDMPNLLNEYNLAENLKVHKSD